MRSIKFWGLAVEVHFMPIVGFGVGYDKTTKDLFILIPFLNIEIGKDYDLPFED